MRNIESKFQCADHELIERLALGQGAEEHGILEQEDHFFPAPAGRLKLRVVHGQGQLIAYTRSDATGARPSDYEIAIVPDPRALDRTLQHALGRGMVVTKKRRLLLLHSTRIHLDIVSGLGRFVELETVADTIGEAAAREEHDRIVELLRLSVYPRIASAYVDLLPSSYTSGDDQAPLHRTAATGADS